MTVNREYMEHLGNEPHEVGEGRHATEPEWAMMGRAKDNPNQAGSTGERKRKRG